MAALDKLLKAARRRGKREIKIRDYMSLMLADGYTSEEAVELLDDLIRNKHVVLTTRYGLRKS